MGVKKFIKKSVAFVSALAMACSMVVMPAGASYAEEGTPITPSNEPQVYKTAELQSDGTYKITLESFVTGEVDVSTEWSTTPCDIVLVLDQSGSMAGDMSSETTTTYTAKNSQEYTYNNYGNKTYYYKDNDGKYYMVRSGSYDEGILFWKTTYYYLYYEKNGTTYYLSGTESTSSRPNNITDTSSTIWTGVLYEKSTTTTTKTRLEALKNAATSFINGVEKSADKTKADHRIAIVGFGSGDDKENKNYYYANTELFIGSTQYNYMGDNGKYSTKGVGNASSKYSSAFQSIKTQKSNLEASIKALDANGGTHPDLGIEMANGIFKANSNTYTKDDGTQGTRDRIVVVFTDGEPGDYDGFDSGIANSAISKANTSKNTYNAKVYSIGIFGGADASANPTLDSTSNANKFMHFISSNYPNSMGMSSDKIGERDPEGSYYKSASKVSDLNNIFKEIAQDTVGGSASVTLGKDAISKDIISENFDLPKGITESNAKDYVDVSTVAYEGLGKWSATKVPIDDRSTELSDSEKATISLDKENKTFNVSNFDFSANYVGDGTSDAGVAKATGKKLVIEITGVTAKHSGEDMNTNDSASGIYTGTTLVKAYNEPVVSIPDKSYVLDYGKTVSTNAVTDHNLKAVTKLNTAKPAPSDIPNATTMQGNYGTFDISSLKADGGLKYTPGKINWDGFDTAYVFGQEKDSDKYLWGAVNFIPASSVYYEDDFAKTINKDSDSDVSIVWGGTWTPDKTSDPTDQPQSSENGRYGWDNSYKDNLGYSNGSATKTTQQGATATFTFTGTGVDVYSRTNGNVGLICAELYSGKGAFKDNGKYKPTLKTQYIDNVSSSGDYYQIPTLSFENLPYGEYTVVITAGYNGTGTSGTYYLDGIRVYNPLQGNATAEKAYDQAGESNAQYIKLRDTLIADGFGSIKDGDETVAGSVFIDKIDKTNVIDGTKDDYEKYGPKNEVYLAPGQAIAFEIDGYKEAETKPNVFVGLKALNAKTKATFTCGNGLAPEEEINSSSDLYYPITPTSSGEVIIRNTGTKLLSITKLRVTNASSVVGLSASQSLLSYAQKFDSLKVVENTNTENPSDNDNKDETLDKGDVDIDNPSDNDNNKDDNNQGTSNSIWDKILNNIKHWFRK